MTLILIFNQTTIIRNSAVIGADVKIVNSNLLIQTTTSLTLQLYGNQERSLILILNKPIPGKD